MHITSTLVITSSRNRTTILSSCKGSSINHVVPFVHFPNISSESTINYETNQPNYHHYPITSSTTSYRSKSTLKKRPKQTQTKPQRKNRLICPALAIKYTVPCSRINLSPLDKPHSVQGFFILSGVCTRGARAPPASDSAFFVRWQGAIGASAGGRLIRAVFGVFTRVRWCI